MAGAGAVSPRALQEDSFRSFQFLLSLAGVDSRLHSVVVAGRRLIPGDATRAALRLLRVPHGGRSHQWHAEVLQREGDRLHLRRLRRGLPESRELGGSQCHKARRYVLIKHNFLIHFLH